MKYVTEIEGTKLDLEEIYKAYYDWNKKFEENKFQELSFKLKLEVEVI